MCLGRHPLNGIGLVLALLSLLLDGTSRRTAMIEPNTKHSQGGVQNLKELREGLGLTQNQFAVAIGSDPTTISRWERGVYQPSFSVKQVKMLCKLLMDNGMSVLDLPDDFSSN